VLASTIRVVATGRGDAPAVPAKTTRRASRRSRWVRGPLPPADAPEAPSLPENPPRNVLFAPIAARSSGSSTPCSPLRLPELRSAPSATWPSFGVPRLLAGGAPGYAESLAEGFSRPGPLVSCSLRSCRRSSSISPAPRGARSSVVDPGSDTRGPQAGLRQRGGGGSWAARRGQGARFRPQPEDCV